MRLFAFFVPFLACVVGCSSSSSSPPAEGDAAVDAPADLAAPTDEPPPWTKPTTCPSPPRADGRAIYRGACSFAAGAKTKQSLALTDEERARIPIKHVIVVMKENRSFDHLLGGLKKLQPDVETFPAGWSNSEITGTPVPAHHLDTTCLGFDPDHQWGAMHTAVNGGAMDGFVRSAALSGGDGHFAMGYYDQAELPFYYFLASTYALADHHFPSVQSGTFPNRLYLLYATSDGVRETGHSRWVSPTLPNILDLLDAKHVSWGVYSDGHPFSETLTDPANNWETKHPWKPSAALLDDFANDTVPSVVFVDGLENVDDEHPTADLQWGEAWTKRIYDAAIASKAWQSTAMFWTYDEGGGFFDHVPPPNGCVARPQDDAFYELGVRVPLVAISPWARRHYVSKIPRDHTAITRFIEAVFDLPSLTARDANADALLDMFDFDCAPAPVAKAPDPGTGGCTTGAHISLSKPYYAPGESIVVSFSGGPGNPKDWIALYPKGTLPHTGAPYWVYVGGGHTAGAGLASGTVTLDMTSAGSATWPLPKGTAWT
ncbi:MAG: phospholipase C, partial [Polyangiales bacterium]